MRYQPELFCKKRFSEKFCKFHRKTSALETLFNKVADLKACNFIKRDSKTGIAWDLFKNIYFEKCLRTTTSTLFIKGYFRSARTCIKRQQLLMHTISWEKLIIFFGILVRACMQNFKVNWQLFQKLKTHSKVWDNFW